MIRCLLLNHRNKHTMSKVTLELSAQNSQFFMDILVLKLSDLPVVDGIRCNVFRFSGEHWNVINGSNLFLLHIHFNALKSFPNTASPNGQTLSTDNLHSVLQILSVYSHCHSVLISNESQEVALSFL